MMKRVVIPTVTCAITRTIFSIVAAVSVISMSATQATARQAGDMPLVALLGQGVPAAHAGRFAAFRMKLRELGYIEGHTIRFAYRYAEGKLNRLPALAAALVRLKPAVIVTTGTPSTDAARKATSTIPIVMHAGDPVRSGLVTSLAPPGGNITGYSISPGPEFSGQRLEILKEAVPSARRIGVLYEPRTVFTTSL